MDADIPPEPRAAEPETPAPILPSETEQRVAALLNTDTSDILRRAYGLGNGIAWTGLSLSPLIIKPFVGGPLWLNLITASIGLVGGYRRQNYIRSWDSKKLEGDVVRAVDFEFASYRVKKHFESLPPYRVMFAGAGKGVIRTAQNAVDVVADLGTDVAAFVTYVAETGVEIFRNLRGNKPGELKETFEARDKRWNKNVMGWLAAKHWIADPAAKPASREAAIKMIAAKADGPSTAG